MTSKSLSLPRPIAIRRGIPSFVLVLYSLALGLTLGLGSAYYALSGPYPLGALHFGPWTTWPLVGSSEIDPYARAIVLKRADIPLTVGEGVALIAETDSSGSPLDAKCLYRVGSVTPRARAWTLTAYDSQGTAVTSDLRRAGFTSAEVMREQDGAFNIVLSHDLQPGNWVRLMEKGPFHLVLRLYDTPAFMGTRTLETFSLPNIERQQCRP